MKVSIVYHSETGNTKKVGEIIAKGVKKVEDTEVQCMSIEEVDKEYIEDSDVVIFGTPTYAGSYSWQMKKWLDTCKLKFAGKIGSVFATENYLGGGADNAELAIISELLVKGMFVFSVGSSKGQPYTHFGPVCIKDGTEEQKERAEIFGQRVAKSAKELMNR
ncbi:flavodoxin family protein [Abyssisolibacter fermentans]|uniref:flavodoxin family protein n=1 Tax=Abyssisolibacter fermentans TaxID=1766203 RepID=UPI000836E977|nr:flavodoxin family protein [Abyssisolibacter fermentans]